MIRIHQISDKIVSEPAIRSVIVEDRIAVYKAARAVRSFAGVRDAVHQ